jgi:hypothetical protein
MSKKIQVNKLFLQKIAEFTNIVLDKVAELEAKVQSQLHKEAAEVEAKEKYSTALRKAARALYDADFLIDSDEQKQFLSKASEDSSYVPKMLEKVCKASEVSLIGTPARVAQSKVAVANDPVYSKAFGTKSRGYEELLDIE